MKIRISESTAMKKEVRCARGHEFEAWYIATPDGIVIEFGRETGLLPKNRDEAAYVQGTCCFKAACELAWNEPLPI